MHKDQIVLAVALGYLLGISVGSFFVVSSWIVLIFLAVFIALSFVFPHRKMLFLILPGILFCLGVFSVQDVFSQFREENMRAEAVSGIARVVNDPEEGDVYRHTILWMESCDQEWCPREKILWQAPRVGAIIAGARVAVTCTLTVPKNFNTTFDYRMFLAKDGIGYICQRATRAEVLAEDTRAYLTRMLFIPKRMLEGALVKSLPYPEVGLAEGLLLGGNHRLPEPLKQAFIKAGLSHIMAVSGYNIALIAQAFVILGIGMGLWRRQSLWFSAIGIVLFILLVGAPASAVRAGIMALTVFGALFFGRLSQSVTVLVMAAVVMLFFQPLLLRYDVGFQLSFLATLAIILTLPIINHLIGDVFFGKSFVEIALLTFAVELFIIPLLLYQFQIFSPFAFLANVVLLPLVPYAMAGAFVSGVAFLLLPGLHFLPAIVTYIYLRGITFVTEWISTWPGVSLEFSMSIWMVLCWYGFLFFAIVRMKRSVRKQYVRTKNI